MSPPIKEVLADVFVVLENADTKTNILNTQIFNGFKVNNPTTIIYDLTKYIKEKNDDTDTSSIRDRHSSGKYGSFYSLYEDVKIACAIAIRDFKVGSKQYNEVDFFYKFISELLLRESARLKVVELSEKRDEILEPTDLEMSLEDDFNKISSTYFADNGEIISIIHETEVPMEPQNVYSSNSLYTHMNQQSQHNEENEEKTILKQPMFTSLTKKSSVDPRASIIPEPFTLTKVLPINPKPARESSTMYFFSNSNSNIPSALNSPPELMLNFFHPNWYTLAVPNWINYQVTKPDVNANAVALSSKILDDGAASSVTTSDPNLSSFAPSYDSRSAVINQEFKANVWLEHIGFEKIETIRQAYLKSKEADSTNDIEMDAKDTEVPETVTKPETETETETETDTATQTTTQAATDTATQPTTDTATDTVTETATATATDTSTGKKIENENEIEISKVPVENEAVAGFSDTVNINDLVEWDPIKISVLNDLQSDAKKLAESKSSFQKLISLNIAKLNKLRQSRYLTSSGDHMIEPSIIEIKLYHKIVKLITLFIEQNDISTDKVALQFSKKLPVLLNEYAGVLPALKGAAKAGIPNYSGSYVKNGGRLPSIRGPYKKKNRMY